MNHLYKRVYQLRSLLVLLVFTVLLTGTVLAQNQSKNNINTLIVGGGSAHDFDKWYGKKDVETLGKVGINAVYTEDPADIRPALEKIDVLILANNKAIPGEKTRKGIFQFVKQGGGLIISHAAAWYNWGDWPEYNKKLVSGGSRGHVHTSPFTVNTKQSNHPILKNVTSTFQITDELYYYKKDKDGPPINVLAKGTHKKENKTYPVLWTVQAYQGRIVCNTLGHDGRAHKLPEYKQLLVNSVRWAAKSGRE